MGNEVILRIVEFAKQEFNNAYGYVGIMTNSDMAILNTTDKEGNDIKLNITIEK